MSELAYPSDELHDRSGIRKVRINVQGLPEDVQWIADALEVALPGTMDWHCCALQDESSVVEIKGVSHNLDGLLGR